MAAPPPPEAGDGPEHGSGGRTLDRVALALVLLPLVVSAVALAVHFGSGYHAIGDNALNELRTRDIGRHAVLIGPYSRDGWNHPGPAMYYLLAIPYLIAGRTSVAMALGALLINAGAITGIALTARRLGGRVIYLFALTGCALLVRASGASFLRDPWNPFIPVLPFGLVVVLTWAMVCGEAWALPLAVFVGSFCMQTHIGYAPLVVPLVAIGAVWLLGATVRERRRTGGTAPPATALIRAAGIALAVLVVMWLPPLIDQLTNSPGNLTRILRYFRNPPEAAHRLAQGYRVVAAQFTLRPEWLVGASKPNAFSGETPALFSTPIPVLVLPFLAAVVVLWRRRVVDGYRLCAVVVAGLVLTILSVARTTGPLFAYRLHWTWTLAMLAYVAVAWAAWTLLTTRPARAGGEPMRWLARGSLAAMVLLGTVSSVNAARADTPGGTDAERMATMLPQVLAHLPKGDGVVLVRPRSGGSQTFVSGLVLGLERNGVTAQVENTPTARQAYGAHRTYAGGPVRALLFTAADEDIATMSGRKDLRMIASAGSTVTAGAKAAIASIAQLKADFAAKRLDAHTYIIRLEVAQRRLGSGAAVFQQVQAPPTG